MRLAPALLLASLLAATPVLAQDATTPAPAEPAAPAPTAPAAPAPVEPPDVATIGPNADRDFWCALAFSLASRAGQIGANETLANTEATKSQTLFAGLVTTMKTGGFNEGQFNALTSLYTIALLDPFATPKFTREQCEAAVPEAKATIDAAQAEAAAAAPDAPADAPAAPETPGPEAPAAQ